MKIDNLKKMDGIVLAIIALVVLSFFMGSQPEYLSDNTKVVYETQKTQSIPPENIQNGIDRLKSIKWIKDVHYDPSDLVKWNVAIVNDGRNISWAISSICSMLKQHDAFFGEENIRIVDIGKVANGAFYKNAEIAIMPCNES